MNRALRFTPLAAVLLLVGMFLVIGAWADYDIFWHLSNGRLWVEHGIFPSPDRFSWSTAGSPVTSNAIQADRLFYLVWDQGGASALAIMAALLFVGALMPFTLMIGRLGLNPVFEALALIFMTMAFLPYRGARPHLIGAMLFGMLVLLCERPFGTRKGIASGVILGLWLNLHGSFMVGFLLIGIALVTWALLGDRIAATNAGLALLIGGGATVLSPIGFELWLLPFQISSNDLLMVYNRDWFGLRPMTAGYAPMGVLILAATVLGVWRKSDPRTLAALILILPTIHYARFTPFTATILGIVVVERLAERAPWMVVNPLSEFGRSMADRRLTKAAAAILVVGMIVVGSQAPSQMSAAAFQPMPETAVDRLIACGAPGPVWNHYDWGGYVLWQGDGLYTVVIDGRADEVYRAEQFEDYFTSLQGGVKAAELVQTSPAQYILMPKETPLVEATLPGWQLAYSDDLAVLAKRDSAVWNC